MTSDDVVIDIEQIKAIDFKIAERHFSHKEICDLNEKQNSEELEYFYNLWTLKESYIKACGKGLSIPLNSFGIRINKSIGIDFYTESELKTCFFKLYKIDQEYKLSVCSTKNLFSSKVVYKILSDIIKVMR